MCPEKSLDLLLFIPLSCLTKHPFDSVPALRIVRPGYITFLPMLRRFHPFSVKNLLVTGFILEFFSIGMLPLRFQEGRLLLVFTFGANVSRILALMFVHTSSTLHSLFSVNCCWWYFKLHVWALCINVYFRSRKRRTIFLTLEISGKCRDIWISKDFCPVLPKVHKISQSELPLVFWYYVSLDLY